MHDLCEILGRVLLKGVKESLLIIKTTEWQMVMKRFKSFRFSRV